MPSDNPQQLTDKVGSFVSRALTWIAEFFSSIVKFTKASILSLIFILLILLLLTQMDQAFTMLIELVEDRQPKIGLLITFLLLNALALALSHYPIYNYYAANLNNSSKFTTWYAIYPFIRKRIGRNDENDACRIKSSAGVTVKKKWLSRLFKVFVFIEEGNNYQKDDRAHYLRYSLGLLIHAVWILFILKTFTPKFDLTANQEFMVTVLFVVLSLIPLLHYIIIREAVKTAKKRKTTDKLYRKLARRFILLFWTTVAFVLFAVFYPNLFSPLGFFILLITSYLFMFIYLYFRLVRTKLNVLQELYQKSGSRFYRWNINRLKLLFFCSQDYLLLFSMNFIFSVGVILTATLLVLFGGTLPNATPILMAFFFFYYFIIASLGKYFFAYKKIREQQGSEKEHSLRFKIVCISIIVVGILGIVSAFTESRVHELSLIDKYDSKVLSEDDFLERVSAMENDTVFFIASHGGGLKSNAWTLKVMQELYLQTDMKLMDQTVAFSGASGGSLGLALYTGLSKHLKKNESDARVLKKRIDTISRGNYTSSDVTLTFGLDTWRKLWPLNVELPIQDRPYYAMEMYQNYVDGTSGTSLSTQPFRSLWRDVYETNTYFPSLIMNTASTTGRRGILWSVRSDNFKSIFHFSENLADLYDFNEGADKTLGFYEAVSTTNRFPVFSPAAKIPGYGHYIDAGAIDNSGLLGCLDLYFYYEQKAKSDTILKPKLPVFIEIINGKDLYVDHIINSIIQEEIHIEEDESNNIKADLDTALNLDKIPGYVSDFIETNPNIEIIRIFMPHKVTIDDVESYLKGEIIDQAQKELLQSRLDRLNKKLYELTEDERPETRWGRFIKPWQSYEPKLARHLSPSSLHFMDAAIKSASIQSKVAQIKAKLK